MSDIFLQLSWQLQVAGGPPNEVDRPSSSRVRLDEEIRSRYRNGLISAHFLMCVDREAVGEDDIRE
eukprot:7624064-Karenia_brevis.AAC.1